MINETVLKLIETDDGYTEKSNKAIIRHYLKANKDQKIVIDSIFISLTGYPLNDIIEQSEKQ